MSYYSPVHDLGLEPPFSNPMGLTSLELWTIETLAELHWNVLDRLIEVCKHSGRDLRQETMKLCAGLLEKVAASQKSD